MTKKAIRVFAMAVGFTAMLATSSLSAQQGIYSEKVNIPFAFHVEKVTLPAGEYRLEREFGKSIVTLVNLQTGQRVRILRSESSQLPGKARLVFESGPKGQSLKKIS